MKTWVLVKHASGKEEWNEAKGRSMNALVDKLRRMAEDKALPIGEAWNALDEAADALEEAHACLESFCQRDAVYMDTEVNGILECSCSCCSAARDAIEKANRGICLTNEAYQRKANY